MKGKKSGKEIGFLVGFFLKLEKERRVLNFWFALLYMNCFRVTVVLFCFFLFFFKKRTKILFVCFLHVFFFSNHSLFSGYIYFYFHFYIT